MNEIKSLLNKYTAALEELSKALSIHSDTFIDDLTDNMFTLYGGDEISWVSKEDDEGYSEEIYGPTADVGNYLMVMVRHGDRVLVFDKKNKNESGV